MTPSEWLATIGTPVALAVGVVVYLHTSFATTAAVADEIAAAKKAIAVGDDFVQAGHRFDYYSEKVESARRYLEYLESIDADPERIESVRGDLNFWKVEQARARDALKRK